MISATRYHARCVVLVSIRSSSGIPCTSKVDLAMNVYDKVSVEDIRAGLKVVSQKLLGSDLLARNLLPATSEQPQEGDSSA